MVRSDQIAAWKRLHCEIFVVSRCTPILDPALMLIFPETK